MFLFFCIWAAQGLTLKSGQMLVCDAFMLRENLVILQLKGESYSLSKNMVNWDIPVQAITGDDSQHSLFLEEPEDLYEEPYLQGYDFLIEKLEVKEASLIDVLRLLADQVGFNMIIDQGVPDTPVTFSFNQIRWQDALAVLLGSQNLSFEFSDQVLQVGMFSKYSRQLP